MRGGGGGYNGYIMGIYISPIIFHIRYCGVSQTAVKGGVIVIAGRTEKQKNSERRTIL